MEILAALFLVLVLVAVAGIVSASRRDRALEHEEAQNRKVPGNERPWDSG
jgi:hypothetical protein